MICINKYDINENMSEEIENFAEKENLKIVGKIPYDYMVMESIHELKPIIYYDNSIAAEAIRDMWTNMKNLVF